MAKSKRPQYDDVPGPRLYHGAGLLSLILILKQDCLLMTSDDEGTDAVFLAPELDLTWKYTSAAFGYESPDGGIIVLDTASLASRHEIIPHRYLKGDEVEFIVEAEIRNVTDHIVEIVVEQENVAQMLADPKAIWEEHDEAVESMGYFYGTMEEWFGNLKGFEHAIQDFINHAKVRIIPDRSHAMQPETLPTP